MIGICTKCGRTEEGYTEEERNDPKLLCSKCESLKRELESDLENAIAYGKTIDKFLGDIFYSKKGE